MTLAAFAAALSMTTISILVPGIGRSFAIGTGEAHWVASGFMAAMLPAMLATPWLVHRLGLRRTVLIALAGLVAGSLCGAMAPLFGMLVAARVLEGLAAGVLQPLPVLVVARAFDAGQRGRAMGLFTLGIALAPAIGPALAGPAADQFGWRWVLLGPALFASLAMLAVRRSLPEGIDAPSMGSTLRPALFGHARFRRACLVALLYGAAVFGSGHLMPILVLEVLRHSAAATGAAMLPGGLALVLFSPWGGRLADRFERHRLIAVGTLALGLAHLPVLGLLPASSLLWFSVWMVLVRLGMAVALPPLAIDALRGLEAADWPAASTWVGLSRQLGAALGIAAVSMTVSWRLAAGDARATAFHAGLWLVVGLSLATAWVAWRNDAAARP
jgi:MFS transporter, DHA2 family, multidrug resistance protein